MKTIPRNILKEKHPFVLLYPSLFPDGHGGLHDESRKIKLTPQEWIMQRLLNINPVFARNKPFLFSAVSFVEMHRLTSNMNVSYLRGKLNKNSDGHQFLSTEDSWTVFDNIPGSPKYWQKMRYDLIAKIEQHGPVQFFYTLSCANKRWDENIATILAKTRPDLKVLHSIDEHRYSNFTKDDSVTTADNDENNSDENQHSTHNMTPDMSANHQKHCDRTKEDSKHFHIDTIQDASEHGDETDNASKDNVMTEDASDNDDRTEYTSTSIHNDNIQHVSRDDTGEINSNVHNDKTENVVRDNVATVESNDVHMTEDTSEDDDIEEHTNENEDSMIQIHPASV